MREGTTRSVKGVALSIVGCLIMLVFGNPALPSDMLFVPNLTYVNLATPVGQLSFICGVLILAFCLVMTKRRKPGGIIIMILAIVSIIGGLSVLHWIHIGADWRTSWIHGQVVNTNGKLHFDEKSALNSI